MRGGTGQGATLCRRMRWSRSLRVAAVVLTALALVPAGAHVLALPNKIDLPQASYFIVQGIYAGWWIGGLAWAVALAANAALALVLRHRGEPWGAAAMAAILLALAFAVFFGFTEPANHATASWTDAPPDWKALRQRREWSHATNAVVILAALACTSRAATERGRGRAKPLNAPRPAGAGCRG